MRIYRDRTMHRLIPAAKLIELLGQVPPGSFVVVNQVENLSILKPSGAGDKSDTFSQIAYVDMGDETLERP